MASKLGFVPLPPPESDSSESPTLSIDCFNPRAILDFGDVPAGRTAIRHFTLENPHDEPIELKTVKFPPSRNLLLHGYSLEESRSHVYKVPSGSCIDINVAWTPEVTSSGGMRQTLELSWERKRFIVILVGFIVEPKQKKKPVKRVVKKAVPKKPLNLSLEKDEDAENKRFKGIANQTANQTGLGLPEKGKEGKEAGPVLLTEANSPTPLIPQLSLENIVTPFAALDSPPVESKPYNAKPVTPVEPTKAKEEEAVKEAGEAPTKEAGPSKSSTPEEASTSGNSEVSPTDAGSKTPRKRRTWGAIDSNPLSIGTPTVVTRSRAALNRVNEENTSMAQQTFMECHTMLGVDSILSPPRAKSLERPPLLAPFPAPDETLAVAAAAALPTSPPLQLQAGGPLTATPMHPSMLVKLDRKDAGLPCFDTSIIPHGSPKPQPLSDETSPRTPLRKSEAFVIPAIETTTSTVDMSQEGPVASTPAPQVKAPPKSTKVKPVVTKPKRPEFKAPTIMSAGSSRPKTAPGRSGLAGRDTLRKTLAPDASRRPIKAAKRRSASADRVEKPKPKPISNLASNSKMPKRKDLLTPGTMCPPKSPVKRLRPLQRLSSADDAFREKRHRSADVLKTPNEKSKAVRRSVAPTTGKRIKVGNTRTSGVLPRHPLAMTSLTNVYFDEKWKIKQERAFTVWMNFHLCPPQGSLPPSYQTSRDVCKNAVRKAKKGAPPVPHALARIQAERKLFQAERRANAIFQSAGTVLLKLEREINDGGLTIREDRKLDADLGLKDQLIDLLLCYNPVWLRLGLEILYEEVIPLTHHQDMPGMVAFLNSRFVNNPVIAQRYAHPTVPGSHAPGYETDLRKFTLKRFLMLVLLLDMSKSARVLEHDPCLFCLNAPHKTSRSLLIKFSNTFLSGEGDITKHLSYIGYTVEHEQKPIEEFDYTVSRIETDLRDGTRLARLTEILTETPLCSKLRVPTVSRLQKAHNVQVMLGQLLAEGVKLEEVPGGPIDKYAIVDGNQNLTLALIWNVIFQYAVPRILAVNQLQSEISILKTILTRRKKQFRPSLRGGEEDYVLGLPSRRLSVNEGSFFRSAVLTTLMEWCQTVCSFYDVPVDNFTVSFSDGRVFCLLVHHYHPELVPFHRIAMNTAHSQQLMEMDLSRDFLVDPVVEHERFRENERENFRLLAEAMSGLAGVPAMIFSQDMVGTIPDERVVITFVAYLCASLVDISQEFRAAQRIQRLWRRYKFLQRHEKMRSVRRGVMKVQALMRRALAARQLVHLRANREAILAERREYAARRIQHAWRGAKEVRVARGEFLAQRGAAVTVQRWYRAILEVRWKDRICAARRVQAVWRGHSVRRQVEGWRVSVVKIQAAVRGHQCRERFLAQRSAASLIAVQWRANVLMKEQRAEFQAQRAAAGTVQRYWRGHAARKRVERLRSAQQACLFIQSVFRGVQVRSSLKREQCAAATIQNRYRAVRAMRSDRQRFLALRSTALTLQSIYRGALARREMERSRAAVVRIQASVRGWLVRCQAEKERAAAVRIQTWYRGHRQMVNTRSHYLAQRSAAVTIQSYWRMILVQRRVAVETASALKIQTAWRMHRARSHFLTLRQSVLRVQSAWRQHLLRKQTAAARKALLRTVLTLQAIHRGRTARQHLALQKSSATLVQAVFRGWRLRRRVALEQRSAAIIQERFRAFVKGRSERAAYLAQKSSAVVIQAHVRGWLVRVACAREGASAALIQAAWRGWLERRRYERVRAAALLIQSHVVAWLVGRRERERFLWLRECVVRVQAAARGAAVRRAVGRQHRAAGVIQRVWRGYRVRREMAREREAAVRLQSAWRMVRERRAYLRLREAAVVVQAGYRMYRCVQQYRAIQEGAVLIQAAFRGYRAARDFRRTRASAVRIQAVWKGHRTRRVYQCLLRVERLKRKLLGEAVSLEQVSKMSEDLQRMGC